eukprot:COSAG01_NODE_2720_length_7187_cov_3.163516_1_plen_72_part_00
MIRNIPASTPTNIRIVRRHLIMLSLCSLPGLQTTIAVLFLPAGARHLVLHCKHNIFSQFSHLVIARCSQPS